MASVVHFGPIVPAAPDGRHTVQAGRAVHRRGSPSFHHVLAAALTGSHAATHPAAVHKAASRVPWTGHPGWVEKPPSVIPAHSDAALQQAMQLEGVPQSWQSSLRFIMAQESGGQVNAKNPWHSARGLYQLTAANYHLNPNGARSFGNAVEEAQGGIRYIQQRYGTAANAEAFWRQHHWY
jgi:hypothetical protein